MRFNDFVDGLLILRKYYTDPKDYHVAATHDELAADATDTPMSPDDVQTMKSLDWFQPDQEDGADYDPDIGWHAFT